ncbi:hypothetical protein SDRG_04843 [Saprolegnia diclina VS20]|uniref:Transmembrane protein n=1 Tax=Saprolegnia diclina (strain VS20) TaxID=1156394 RepID=T0QIH9_SAPDV|nr:hypothetical protein SDRG_04843 [Saprolegnia diclina VS20]EQC37819.1 hypothetical protein SDRG_04843 [Saprolegnia diclina VS20]|eukprot:XP_008608752.1 hypothetical protein SDRG_04843 [Saprolegnia diclina VS20]
MTLQSTLSSAALSISNMGSAFSSSTRKYDAIKRDSMRVWMRIIANLVVVAAIYGSLSSMFILSALGAFRRSNLTYHFQNDAWRPLAQSCLLTSEGFAPHSCSSVESSLLATPAAWAATGNQLAHVLQVPPQAKWKVTTCMVGCSSDANDSTPASLQMLVGYDVYPECNPQQGSQSIAGMILLEGTVVDDVYPNGAYLLTVFADTHMNTTTTYVDSDDSSTTRIIRDVERVLIGRDGSAQRYPEGANAIIKSHPLGPRYSIRASCVAQIVDISDEVGSQRGWSTGRESKKAVVTGKACGHVVSESIELEVVHAVLVIITIVGLGGDMLMTFEGLKGVLQHKPVLTYDILTGVERRKGLLFIGAISAFPGLLFFDIARIYAGRPIDDWLWLLSILTLGIFVAWFALLLFLGLQFVPSPPSIRHKLAPWSPAVFIYGAIPSISASVYGSYEDLHASFFAATSLLGMNVSGRVCGCGAYDANSIASATSLTLGNIVIAVCTCFLMSIVYAMAKLQFFQKKCVLDTTWTKNNEFLSQSAMPYWFTGLPLDQADAIKIGNKLFCKPSMQARMGLAAVVIAPEMRRILVAKEAKVVDTAPEEVFYLVSVYDLVWGILPRYLRLYMPMVQSEIVKNVLTAPTKKRLQRAKTFKYSRGTCVG